MGLYTRRQLLLLFGLVAAAGLGLGIGHWRALHPDLVAHLESLDRTPAPPTTGLAAGFEGGTLPEPAVATAEPRPPEARVGRETTPGGRAHRRAPAARALPGDAPAAAPAPRPRTPGDRAESAPGLVDINRGSLEELTRLPGIGPVLAARIVEARQAGGPFAAVDDLRRVPGVGPSTLRRLRSHVTVGE